MKLKKTFSSLITNKYVLYLVATIAFINVFGYMMMGKINSVIFFMLVGYIMTFFSKNMIIVLLVPMVLTSLLMVGMKVKENFQDAKASDEEEDEDAHSDASKMKPDSPIIMPLDNGDSAVNDESFKTRDQPLEYSNVNEKRKSSSSRIDHGATIENAYDTLNKIIGGPGFEKMTEDTKRLMEQQQKLAQSMEQFGPMLDSIKPFLDKAQGLLGNLDVKGYTDAVKQTQVTATN